MLSPDSEIVVYCDGDQCDLSHRLMTLLRERGGYAHVRVLVNGWTTWRKAGFPTEKGAES
jgi:3-mercaptopyruvate sulfurtransferase SseA